jgi:hypothetical protein
MSFYRCFCAARTFEESSKSINMSLIWVINFIMWLRHKTNARLSNERDRFDDSNTKFIFCYCLMTQFDWRHTLVATVTDAVMNSHCFLIEFLRVKCANFCVQWISISSNNPAVCQKLFSPYLLFHLLNISLDSTPRMIYSEKKGEQNNFFSS